MQTMGKKKWERQSPVERRLRHSALEFTQGNNFLSAGLHCPLTAEQSLFQCAFKVQMRE